MKKFIALLAFALMAGSFSWSYTARVHTSTPRASTSRPSAPRVSTPKATAPKVTAPKAVAPKVTTPKVTTPKATTTTITESTTTSKSATGGYKVSPVTPKATDGYTVSPAVPHTSKNWWDSDYDSGNAPLRGKQSSSTVTHTTTVVPVIINEYPGYYPNYYRVNQWNGVALAISTQPAPVPSVPVDQDRKRLSGLQIAGIVALVVGGIALLVLFVKWLSKRL